MLRLGTVEHAGPHRLAFRLARAKNKLGQMAKPFNVHLNCYFQAVELKKPLLVEVQLLPASILPHFARSHRLYEISRAQSVHELVKDTPARTSAARRSPN